MFKTGNTFTDILLLGITFLPLLPALFIFIRRRYGEEPFHFLAVACVLCFLRDFIGLSYPLTQPNRDITDNLFSFLIFLLFAIIFRGNMGGRMRYGLTLLLTALVSMLFTYWSLKGWGDGSFAIGMLLNGVLVVIIAWSLPIIIRNDELGVFRSPLFWIESGTLFYLLIALLLEGLGSPAVDTTPDPEKRLFLGLADLVRYCSYIVAVFAV